MDKCKQCKKEMKDDGRANNKRFCQECNAIRRSVSNHKYYLNQIADKKQKYAVKASNLNYTARTEEIEHGKKDYLQ